MGSFAVFDIRNAIAGDTRPDWKDRAGRSLKEGDAGNRVQDVVVRHGGLDEPRTPADGSTSALSLKPLDPSWLNRQGRRVLCCDLDTFFVSVERLYDKSLIGKPVIVGGPKGARGVVAACSYEARKYGVKSGISLWQAGNLCPNGEFVHGRGHSYAEHSERVRGILAEYLPDVRAASIDEFYCDVTGLDRIWKSTFELGHFLRREIFVRTGLPITIGGGRNRLIAKVANGFAKPDGLYIVPEGFEKSFLAPMHVSKLPGIGPKTTTVLERHGIKTLGDLSKMSRIHLYTMFGRWGLYLWEKSHGREVAIYQERQVPRSLGHEATFRADLNDRTKVADVMHGLLEKAGYRLRTNGLKCRELTIKLRYFDFETHTAQTTIPLTNVDRVIWPFALSLLAQLAIRKAAVRLVGVRLSDLHPDDGQMELFSPHLTDGRLNGTFDDVDGKPLFSEIDDDEGALELARDAAWHGAVDAIRLRYGYDSIATGPTMKRLIERSKRKAGVGEAGGLEVERAMDYARR